MFPLTPKGRRMLALIQEQRKLGGTVAGFCRSRNLNPGTFHWWRNQLKTHLKDRPAGRIAEAPARFVEVKPPSNAMVPFFRPGRIELSFPDGRRLCFPVDYPSGALAEVLRGSGCA